MSDHVSFSPGLDAGLFYIGGAKKEGYFGISNVNEENYVRKVCANISKLIQQWKDGRKLIVLTPEELFQPFLRESTNLPDDTSTWTLQLL